jgi:hypothetical protein
MLQFSDLGEQEPLPALSPFAMRSENLVVNRSTVRGSPIIEAALTRAPEEPPRAPPPPPPPPPPQPPAPPPPAPTQWHPPQQMLHDLPSIVYLLLGLNAVTIALCLTLILGRR